MKKILLFFGTRPEAIKMAPVVEALRLEPRFRVRIAVSAQHRQMLDQVLSVFHLRSDADLDIMKPGQTLFDITADVLLKFRHVLRRERPDLVLVHGDTTTTLAGALASFYQRIPVGHVEAGLRTRDMNQPFPEEANRRLADALTTLHFAPTAEAARNLVNEQLPKDRIFVTGNTVIDALRSTVGRDRAVVQRDLARALARSGDKRLILLTAHRRENFGWPLASVFQAVSGLSRRFPDVHWIYPVHLNPNVKGAAKRRLGRRDNVHLIAPVDYGDLVAVLKRATLVVTDSGGLQEEAPSLGKPVLVLREVTERPEAVRAGTVRLVGTDKDRIVREVSGLLTNSRTYARMAAATNPYGDGRASERIRDAVRWHFGFRRRPPAPFLAS